MKGKTYIFFDLDGTLLSVNMDQFVQYYFKLLSDYFSDLYNPEYFVDIVNQATAAMIKNDGKITNREVFDQKFFDLIELGKVSKEEIWERFHGFYNDVFPTLSEYFTIDNFGYQIVEIALDHNYELVIATNPLFPKQAIIDRLRWMNLNPGDFRLITSYENMHYCKPNINYYNEIIKKLNCTSNDCVMVGNDLRDDMVAKKLGIKTFLVEDFEVKRAKVDIEPDWQGSRKEILNYIKRGESDEKNY
ncbi:MAG: HAD family hydrolase [Halanaerobiales bacterium]|nr:HAD family hydrolase [Halanaerobiales bacterium]